MIDTFRQYYLPDMSFIISKNIKHDTMNKRVDKFIEDDGGIVWAELCWDLVMMGE